MNVLLPLFAALLQSSSFTLDKAALNVRRIDWKTYTSISFPLLMVFDAMFLFIVRPHISWALLGGQAGLFVAITIVTGYITNALYYRALDDDALHEMQTWSVFLAIPTLIVTSVIFADERKLAILIPALIATAAVTWSHLGNGKGLVIRRNTAAFIGWMALATPAMAAMSKVILRSWDPILLELVRDSTLAVIFWLTVSQGLKHVNSKAWTFLLATNICSSAAWIMYYYGFQRLGIVQTMLVFSLMPLLTYFFSVVFLHEKPARRQFIAFLVVLASIAVAQALG